MKQYHKNNFHKHTFCVYKEVANDAIKNLQPNFSSKSGSSYYFTEEGLYRVSNHWGRAANCRWKLDSSAMTSTTSKNIRSKVGYAKWTDFYPNNEQENLFYIQVDFETKTVAFLHKDNPDYDGKLMCRNASETAKRIKICKEVLQENKWCNYIKYDNLEELQIKIIRDLLITNKSFVEIKRQY
ncbi:hypothetical protein ACFO3U_07800 [Flavobacterium ponti]|uniref:DUF4304 domain-containing protein n=1 Tax=Flavobacterium ponti TaxID=665133 RepID=A0ABV9P5B1_9FLAO